MTTYRIHRTVTVEFGDAFHGRIRITFDAGEVEPESEQAELALERLVRQGHAERCDDEEDN